VIACLFSGLASAVFIVAKDKDPSYLLTVVIFATIGLTSFVIALLGTDRAVAKIWGSH
jgi:hypothetical protein